MLKLYQNFLEMFNMLKRRVLVLQMSVLTSRKSSSTPSLNEVNDNKPSVAATEQASSADNLTQTVKSVCTIGFL